MRHDCSISRIFFLGSLLPCALCSAASAPTLPPVRAGLWHVTSTMHFEPDPEPESNHWPGLNKPREQNYEICLTNWRAAQPMTPPQTENLLRVGDDTLALSAPAEALGSQGRVEWHYRRISDIAFDGAQTLASGNSVMALKYQARFVAAQCGQVVPASESKFGEP